MALRAVYSVQGRSDRHPHGPASLKSSVCILTAYDSRYKDIAAISIPSMRRFADARGYDLRVVERNDCTRRGGWMKIEPIRDALAGAFDFVLWIDADVWVARTEIDVRNVVQPGTHLHLAWHAPPPGGDPPHFNTGVMLIRASDWSRDFLRRVWEAGPLRHRWNDQATIHHVLGYDWIAEAGDDRDDDIRRAPLSRLNITWNSIPGVCQLEEPVIWHYAGMDMPRRLALMSAAQAASGKAADRSAAALPRPAAAR